MKPNMEFEPRSYHYVWLVLGLITFLTLMGLGLVIVPPVGVI